GNRQTNQRTNDGWMDGRMWIEKRRRGGERFSKARLSIERTARAGQTHDSGE
ncbi:hypothetical protein WN48_01766, partial [Eufriesea mexicana]